MKRTGAVTALLLIALVLAGCSSERYGAGIDSGIPNIKVKDVFLNPDFIGKAVNLEGRISSQCGSNGCWFVLQDDTGQVFINLAPSNMTLPPRMNKTARVTGLVYPVQGELQVIAKGIEVR